ncbi:MAG: hypothetical protein WCQ21_26590 [Verrucomicrobiota bacterium]
MGDFVNYKKRSVSLPPGCKDLIDVLSRRPERRFQEFAELLKSRGVNPKEAMKILTSEELVAEEVKRLLSLLEKK